MLIKYLIGIFFIGTYFVSEAKIYFLSSTDIQRTNSFCNMNLKMISKIFLHNIKFPVI